MIAAAFPGRCATDLDSKRRIVREGEASDDVQNARRLPRRNRSLQRHGVARSGGDVHSGPVVNRAARNRHAVARRVRERDRIDVDRARAVRCVTNRDRAETGRDVADFRITQIKCTSLTAQIDVRRGRQRPNAQSPTGRQCGGIEVHRICSQCHRPAGTGLSDGRRTSDRRTGQSECPTAVADIAAGRRRRDDIGRQNQRRTTGCE